MGTSLLPPLLIASGAGAGHAPVIKDAANHSVPAYTRPVQRGFAGRRRDTANARAKYKKKPESYANYNKDEHWRVTLDGVSCNLPP